METALPGTSVNPTPLVSVCMITYNHASYIRQAIEGVLMQRTDFGFELIIGEDCGPDATRTICKEYAEHYPDKIRLLPREHNLGVIANFFSTLGAATGKYIAFCEGDDYWTDPLKLQRQVGFLEANPDYGLVYTEVDFLFQKKQEVKQSVFANKIVRNHDDLESFLIDGGFKAPCTWLFRRELMGLLNPDKIASDATFVVMLEFMGYTRIKFLPESTAVYRYLPESASHSKDIRKSLRYFHGLLETQQTYISKYNLPERAYDKAGRRMYRKMIPWALAIDDKAMIAEIHVFFRDRKKTAKEVLPCFLIAIPAIGTWFYRLKYKLKGCYW